MKKQICIWMIVAVLLSCCGCAGETAPEPTQATTEPVADMLSPEKLYGHIDQTVPMDGVYKIWNEEGVRNMASHPDGSFELLCNVDMKGAVLSPIGTDETPFTGTINGANFHIANFTLQGDQKNFGFVTINKGQLRNLLLQDVTLLPGEGVENAGALAGDNQGAINRCNVSGAMTLSAVPEGASCGAVAGRNQGSVENAVVAVDLLVEGDGTANVGGIVGISTGGKVDYVDTEGKLEVTGANKTIGLFAGLSTDTVFTKCAFVGPANTLNGQLFTNYTGNPDDDELVVALDACSRDNTEVPMPENEAKLRDTVVAKMYELGTLEWHVDKDLRHNCQCSTSACVGVYSPYYTYYGLPYKHGSGTLTSFRYCLDENNYMNDWVWQMDEIFGYDTYIGTMCTTAVNLSLWTVCNSIDAPTPQAFSPYFYPENNCIPVGEGWWEDVTTYNPGTGRTNMYVENRTEQEYYEDMALVHRGDVLNQGTKKGVHTIMVASEPVIVRYQDGRINGDKSYILTHEQQGGAIIDEEKQTWTTWRLNDKNTFTSLYGNWWLATTIEEFVTGEMETPECTIVGGADGRLGLTTGIIQGNYFLDVVYLTITDSEGNALVDQPFFPKAGKMDDANQKLQGLAYVDHYDLANFSIVLQNVMFVPGETYEYTISAHLMSGNDFVLKTDSFVQGGTK